MHQDSVCEMDAAQVPVKNGVAVNEMTSKDYYFDSYAHFGIHEGNLSTRQHQPQPKQRNYKEAKPLLLFLLFYNRDAQRRGANDDLSQLDVPQRSLVQGQGCHGHRLRHGHLVHVRRQGGRSQGHWRRMLEHHRARRSHHQGQRIPRRFAFFPLNTFA